MAEAETIRGEAVETVPADQVLRRLVAELPPEVDVIEFLEIRQATPRQFMVRLSTDYRGDRIGVLLDFS